MVQMIRTPGNVHPHFDAGGPAVKNRPQEAGAQVALPDDPVALA